MPILTWHLKACDLWIADEVVECVLRCIRWGIAHYVHMKEWPLYEEVGGGKASQWAHDIVSLGVVRME